MPTTPATTASVGSVSPSFPAAPSATVTLTCPPGTQPGEMLVALAGNGVPNPYAGGPDGWRPVTQPPKSTDLGSAAYYKLATPADVGGVTTYMFPYAGSGKPQGHGGVILRIPGVDTAEFASSWPADRLGFTRGTSSTTSCAPVNPAKLNPGDLLVRAYVAGESASSGALTMGAAPTGWVERVRAATTDTWDVGMLVCDQLWTGPAPAGLAAVAPPPGGGQTLGVGGVATPAGAVLTTADSTSALTITSGGTAAAPKVYDGQAHTVGGIKIAADNVVVQNFYIRDAHNAGIYSIGSNVTIQNCDISRVDDGGQGDINGVTFFGDNVKILLNRIGPNLVKGDPHGSHTDGIQTWNTPSKRSSSNVLIMGNWVEGPTNTSDVTYMHQGVMAEGKDSTDGGGGGTGASRNWLITRNHLPAGNHCIKLDGILDVHITGNDFSWVGDQITEITSLSTGCKFYSDNTYPAGANLGGISVTPGAGPDPSAWGYTGAAGGGAPGGGGTPDGGGTDGGTTPGAATVTASKPCMWHVFTFAFPAASTPAPGPGPTPPPDDTDKTLAAAFDDFVASFNDVAASVAMWRAKRGL
jgi:hypothetical protein